MARKAIRNLNDRQNYL
ncbi:uncharacterized protein FFMR_15420 [Fusarium fujikuroi]|nr:uncharacterized protein FFMR_15420 [Fusarium fujikuroi]